MRKPRRNDTRAGANWALEVTPSRGMLFHPRSVPRPTTLRRLPARASSTPAASCLLFLLPPLHTLQIDTVGRGKFFKIGETSQRKKCEQYKIAPPRISLSFSLRVHRSTALYLFPILFSSSPCEKYSRRHAFAHASTYVIQKWKKEMGARRDRSCIQIFAYEKRAATQRAYKGGKRK